MVIHSITPAYFLTPQDIIPQLECKVFNNGFVMGTQNKDGFIISQIISTDPKVYLNENYAPGKNFAN